jgi:TRAP-type C4-dicarboxylate transport system permease small subunit
MDLMNATKIVAIVLMVAGILGLAYGGFTYTEDTHEANIGALSLSIDDKRHVNIPVWAGVGMLLVGGVLFANGLKRG